MKICHSLRGFLNQFVAISPVHKEYPLQRLEYQTKNITQDKILP